MAKDDQCVLFRLMHTRSTRTKKDESPHAIWLFILQYYYYYYHFETYIPNNSEEDTPRCDVVTHHWYPGWRSSMPTELGCHRQETTAAGYWFSCKPKAYPQVPLNISLFFCISVATWQFWILHKFSVIYSVWISQRNPDLRNYAGTLSVKRLSSSLQRRCHVQELQIESPLHFRCVIEIPALPTFSDPFLRVRKYTCIVFNLCVAVQTIVCYFCRPVLFLRFVYASNPHMPQVLATRLDLKRLRTQILL